MEQNRCSGLYFWKWNITFTRTALIRSIRLPLPLVEQNSCVRQPMWGLGGSRLPTRSPPQLPPIPSTNPMLYLEVPLDWLAFNDRGNLFTTCEIKHDRSIFSTIFFSRKRIINKARTVAAAGTRTPESRRKEAAVCFFWLKSYCTCGCACARPNAPRVLNSICQATSGYRIEYFC